MKKFIYAYFYTMGIQGQGDIQGFDILAGLIVLPIRLPFFALEYWLKNWNKLFVRRLI